MTVEELEVEVVEGSGIDLVHCVMEVLVVVGEKILVVVGEKVLAVVGEVLVV